MNFENYFVNLLHETGSEKIILVRDDAASPGNEHRNKKQMTKESIADHGPPHVPFRKESSDKLVSLLARGRKKRAPSRTKQLKKFFDEVAPEFKARHESKSGFAAIDTVEPSSKPILQAKSSPELNWSPVV
jgi:hypothetical protein